MNLLEIEPVPLTRLHEIIGGASSRSKDFVVCLNLVWNKTIIGKPYRSESSAVVMCMEGEVELTIDMRRISMKPGSLIMYGRESLLEVHRKTDDCVLDIIFFTNDFIHETIVDLKAVLPIVKYITNNEGGGALQLDRDEQALVEKFYVLTHDCLRYGKPMMIRDLMAAFIRLLSEIYGVRTENLIDIKTRQQEYLERFLEQVALHHKTERSVQFYADALHITPKYLSTVIKDISGHSATALINSFVIQEAKMMLKFSGKSIQEIAYALNFTTQSFFGKYFKRHTGLSPSEYRDSE